MFINMDSYMYMLKLINDIKKSLTYSLTSIMNNILFNIKYYNYLI